MLRSARFSGIIAALMACALVVVNIIRIFSVPLTCDESPSQADLLLGYGDYIHLSRVTANTHILNSILRKFFIESFGNTPFFLRLPNLLGQVVFLLFSYLLCCRIFKDKPWRLGAFAALNLNPLLFEFWGLSRGYGLAISFMTAGIYYLIAWQEDKKLRQLLLTLFCAIAAVYSNFALLNYYVALAGALLLHSLCYSSSGLLRQVIPALGAASGLLALLIAGPVSKLRAAGELYYGGDNGLVSDTIRSLVKESIFISDPSRKIVLLITGIVVLLITAVALYWIIIFFRKRTDTASQTGISLCLLLVIPLLSLRIQHGLLGTRYLIDRTALFLIVLIALNVVFWLYHLQASFPIAGKLAFIVVIGFGTLNFCRHISLNESRMWWFDNDNLAVLKIIAGKEKTSHRRVKLRTSWMQMPSLDYYIYTRYNEQFYPLEYLKDTLGPGDTAYDYCYLPSADIKSLSGKYIMDTAFGGEFFLFEKRRD